MAHRGSIPTGKFAVAAVVALLALAAVLIWFASRSGVTLLYIDELAEVRGPEGAAWHIPVFAQLETLPDHPEAQDTELASQAIHSALRDLYGPTLAEGPLERRPGVEAESLREAGYRVISLELGEPRLATQAPPADLLPWHPTGERFLLVGLDGADWQTIDRLFAEGKLPVLRSLAAEGVRADLRSESPMLSPLLWTTIATGRSPADHGILDFLMWDPVQGKKVPISSRFRKVQAFWDLGERFGFDTTTIAWWGTWPAESVRGIIVSDRLAYALFEDIPEVAEGLTWPPALADELEPLRVSPSALEPADLRRYVPEISRIEKTQDRDTERSLADLREVIASQETYHAVALHLLREQARARHRPPLFALYYQGIDEMGHHFGHLAPPKLEWVDPAAQRLFGDVVDAWYERQDEMLGEVLAAAGPDVHLLLVSDHGFLSGDARPAIDPSELQGQAAAWHRPYGVFLLHGPAVAPRRLATASLYDILPTILYGLGAPISRELEGRPLVEAFARDFRAHNQVARIETWEPDEPGSSAPEVTPAAAGAEQLDEALLARLRSLGYVGSEEVDPGGDASGAAETSTSRGEGEATALYHSNRGAVLLQDGRFEEASAAFSQAIRAAPLPEAYRGRITALAGAGRREEALEAARAAADRFAPREGGFLLLSGMLARDLGREEQQRRWLASREVRLGDSPEYHAEQALLARDPAERDMHLREALALDPAYGPALEHAVDLRIGQDRTAEAAELVRRALEERPGSAGLHHLMGRIRREAGERQAALDSLRRAVELAPDHPGYLTDLAALLGRMERWEEAERLLRRAWRQDPARVEILANLGAALASQGRAEEAIPFLERAAERASGDPRILNALGLALLEADRPEEARQRLAASLEADPGQPQVRRLLDRLAKGGS